jgi:CDP-glucose 4,6-dehydratase
MEGLVRAYSGKKVFLTGHTGFKGAWLLTIFNMLGARVLGYSLPPEEEPNLYSKINGRGMCETEVLADIRDKERVRKEIETFQPDFVFHLAAQSLVRRSYDNPVETYEVNVIGTANVLNALRELDKPCTTVIITTDKVYENREWWYPYREVDALGGYDPYSSSKACAEIAVSSFRRSYFHPANYAEHRQGIASARAGNVIGGGDWAKDRIIPDLVRSLSRNETLIVRNPDAVRPWEHVLEPLSGYLLLGILLSLDPQHYSEAFNFGPHAEDNLTVRQLVECAIGAWGSGDYRVQEDAKAPHEAKMLRLDISKTLNKLEWHPRWNSAQALEQTISWYKRVLDEKESPLTVTQEQIMSYFRKTVFATPQNA